MQQLSFFAGLECHAAGLGGRGCARLTRGASRQQHSAFQQVKLAVRPKRGTYVSDNPVQIQCSLPTSLRRVGWRSRWLCKPSAWFSIFHLWTTMGSMPGAGACKVQRNNRLCAEHNWTLKVLGKGKGVRLSLEVPQRSRDMAWEMLFWSAGCCMVSRDLVPS